MRIVDSHFHWWPCSVFEELCKRSTFPYKPNGRVATTFLSTRLAAQRRLGSGTSWTQLLAHENSQGFETDVVCSTGDQRHVLATRRWKRPRQIWNDEMAGAQKTCRPSVGKRRGPTAGQKSRSTSWIARSTS
jgi:aminocarboxymuconate-semialdehyde decarboxylase